MLFCFLIINKKMVDFPNTKCYKLFNKIKDLNIDLKTTAGYILAYSLENNKNKDYFISILQKYKKKNGFSINSASNGGDIIGNYHALYLLEDFIPLKENVDMKNYRSKSGYSLYSVDNEFTNLYFTYLGFILESSQN